ncbi:hypothetical protein O6H91_13G089100 [Diphasiastrum complanatum]|uniref:Uncharacterized protein n=1 Tax=Diphasiastrum complanatum TaxID=34168 RepID=A0ACC2BWX7_DIPCM|nr:hypothetical protein O6H91_13G089100 [Diphasiastrum complanatum]
MARRARATQSYSISGRRAGDFSTKDAIQPLLSPDGFRLDGRRPHICRPASAGSAYAEFGDTKVIVSIYGPRESKKAEAFSDIGRLNCSVKFTTFATHIRGQLSQGIEDKECSSMLYKALVGAVALHTFPKTTVDVFALVLQSGGGDLPVVISCASLALADAGIVMYDLVCAMSASSVGRQLLLDSTYEEEKGEDGGLMIAHMTSRNEVTQLTVTGQWSSTRLSEALEVCLDACVKLGEVMRTCLKEAALGVPQ